MSASRLLDLKLKCLFEFTEAEQQKLSQQHQQQQQQQQQNEQQNQTLVNSSNLASVTANNTNILEQTTIKQKQTNQQQQQQPTVTKNTNKLSNAADVYSTATESQSSSDFDSTSNVVNSSNISKINNSIPLTIAANVSATRQDKNDNLLNELKLTKEENDTLKKEIARLKVRLKETFFFYS